MIEALELVRDILCLLMLGSFCAFIIVATIKLAKMGKDDGDDDQR